MSIGKWFKRFFSSTQPGDETSSNEVGTAGGSRYLTPPGFAGAREVDYAGAEAEEVLKGELSDEEPPSGPAS